MSGSVVTVDLHTGAQPGLSQRPPNDQSYDLAVIRFSDDGRAAAPHELTDALGAIAAARANPNGAVVVMFIHGWHHNADWDPASDSGDSHFKAFRNILRALTLREAERYFSEPAGGGRRVVGVFVGWDGDPAGWWSTNAGALTHVSFWNRYRAAKRIGERDSLRDAIRAVTTVTKSPLPVRTAAAVSDAPDSPLVLIGHSMGALMLESAFHALLKDPARPLVHEPPRHRPIVQVFGDGQPVSFPDVVIALNSAAESSILRGIRAEFGLQHITKTVTAPGVSYAPPLVISATSTADKDTRTIWRLANLPWLARRTDGHDPTLFTHVLRHERENVTCDPRGFVDFGQNWHCLRMPDPPSVSTPSIPVDLPIRDREGTEDRPPFRRYRLVPLGDPAAPQTTWVFQLPPDVVSNHNDIFNSRASSLILALMQVSGAVMSLAQEWNDTFEAETI